MRDFTEEVNQALDVLFQLNSKSSKKNKLLDKGKTVYLQVVVFKIPFIVSRNRKYLKLRHSLYGNDPEICLFVPNRKTGLEYKITTDELIDYCVEHYTQLLEKHKVKGITTVMPLKQLKSEYGTYDLRRKLVHRFDLFLCKNSLLYNPRFLDSLGKIFKVARKEPLGVPFPKNDIDFDPEFQKNINRALFTSSFYIRNYSDNYSIPIGSLSNTKKELTENLQAVLNQLFKKNIIPGGLENIKAMYVWPSQDKPIPLYMSTELPVNLKKPYVKSKKRRLMGIEGELSTQPGKKVFVMPNGEVFVTNKNKGKGKKTEVSDSESESSFNDDSEEEQAEENLKTNTVKNSEDKESESEDDKEIEEKEAKLMANFSNSEDRESESEDDKEIEEKEAKLMANFSKRQF